MVAKFPGGGCRIDEKLKAAGRSEVKKKKENSVKTRYAATGFGRGTFVESIIGKRRPLAPPGRQLAPFDVIVKAILFLFFINERKS